MRRLAAYGKTGKKSRLTGDAGRITVFCRRAAALDPPSKIMKNLVGPDKQE
jgi:hypothetical protein